VSEEQRFNAITEVAAILTGAWVQVNKASKRADECGNRDLAAEVRHASEVTHSAMKKARLEQARWERARESD
jgi:hypothetical protein